MTTDQAVAVTLPSRQLSAARRAVHAAAAAIRAEFGVREITAYKGPSDVQLKADLVAQRTIIEILSEEFPDYGIVSEEGLDTSWPDTRHTWLVDPLDGTNNFGYGIAHCAIAITLFSGSRIVLALVFDPILGREYSATTGPSGPGGRRPRTDLAHATLSLVTGYSRSARDYGRHAERLLTDRCKRILNLWAPALDLALVSTGALDGIVCIDAKLLDVCAGLHLLEASGACVVGPDGRRLTPTRDLWEQPVSFIAAAHPELAKDLLAAVNLTAGSRHAGRKKI
ncbi:inositol monophosphatase [Actinoplanes sp. NPDC049596]|uniref:inositol monophosphatase family protein n=1 Tax=unclassified Actinoplanes TaxID=2626549 RepID=UPI0034151B32